MKLKLLLTIILLILFLSVYSQTKIIKFPQYHSKVVVFPALYQDNYLNTLENRFTPDSIVIKEVESLLFVKNIENTRCRKNNFRQYFGYRKNDKDYILIKVLNFKNEKKLLKYFHDWQSKYAYILTDIENYPDIWDYYYDVESKYILKFEWGKDD